MKKNKIEYKKIFLAIIVVWAIVLTTILCLLERSTDAASILIQTIIGAFASYCIASAVDKYGMNKFGVKPESEKGDE